MSVSCHPGTCKQHAWVALAGCSEGEGARLARPGRGGGGGLRRCTASLADAGMTENWLPSESRPDGSFQREPCGSVCPF